MPKKQLASEVLIDLHRRLSVLPSRSHERRMIMQETAHLYGISEQTLYRALAQRARPKALRRSDRGTPRVVPQEKMEYYCELIAAIKVRTSNKKGRHLSTGEAIRLIEKLGIETPDGLVKAPPGRTQELQTELLAVGIPAMFSSRSVYVFEPLHLAQDNFP